MLKTVVLLNISVETVIHFFQDSLMNRKFKEQHLFEKKIKKVKVFSALKKRARLLNGRVYFLKIAI